VNPLRLSIFSPLEKVLLVFAAVLVLSCSVLGFLWHRSQGQTRHAALHADSLAAALDTSHTVALSRKDSIKILGDSIHAVGRRVFQVPQTNDALDKALGLQRVAIAQLTAQVAALSVRVSSAQPVTTDTATGARSATFTIDSTPYHDTLHVSLPVAGVGTLKAALHIDRAPIGLRLGCGAKTDGIRSASATLTGPPWLALELGRVEQTPELCNPTPARAGFFKRLFSSCGVGPGYALVFAGGKWVGGPGAVADCHAWP
jgi:hypothetical protein